MFAASRGRNRRTVGAPRTPNRSPWWLIAILLILLGITILVVALAVLGWKPAITLS